LHVPSRAAGGSRKFEGWTDAGRVRYNSLIDAVKSDRTDHSDWDKNCMAKKQDDDEGQSSSRKRQKSQAVPSTAARWGDNLSD
jgi:hypothetical protein